MKKRKLSQSVLQAVRGRLGVEDIETDGYIYSLPSERIVKLWCGWKFGDEGWAHDLIHLVEQAYAVELRDCRGEKS